MQLKRTESLKVKLFSYFYVVPFLLGVGAGSEITESGIRIRQQQQCNFPVEDATTNCCNSVVVVIQRNKTKKITYRQSSFEPLFAHLLYSSRPAARSSITHNPLTHQHRPSSSSSLCLIIPSFFFYSLSINRKWTVHHL